MILDNENKKIRVGVIGGAGYVGGELCRILLLHPNVNLVFVQSKSNAQMPVSYVHDDLYGDTDLCFCDFADIESVDVIFLCGGHGTSKGVLHEISPSDECVVIDLGNDFRLKESSLCGDREFVYGLIDHNADIIKKSVYIANPGCFATAVQLALLPLMSKQCINGDVHITATTGSTGAGQSLNRTSHFSWRESNMSTYKTFTHQHLDEIWQSVEAVNPDFKGDINFIPYRGDFTRGIIATLHLKCDETLSDVINYYKCIYNESPFVFVSDKGINLKQVIGTNKTLISIDKHGDYLLFTVVLDNLIKGAVGQAVENMNLIFSIPRTTGLRLKAQAY